MASARILIDPAAPYVLLEDAAPGADDGLLLYQAPVEVISVCAPDMVTDALERLRAAAERGLHAAGFISYEAGYALEPRLKPLARPAPADGPPLLWFGLFERVERVAVGAILPDPASAWTSPPRPLIGQGDYETGVAAVKEHVLAGDVYQANLTFKAELDALGSPLALYASIRTRAAGRHGGIVHSGDHVLLSFSPELFFTLHEGRLTARPMKGTAARRRDPADDRAAAAALRQDPKQRAENLMIVDLLRNDLARVAEPGSVKVPALFEVETYPTLHQLVSTVTGTVREGLDPIDAVAALFPCGSITGAPKIRAMDVIAGLEAAPRGAYTGAIGRIAPDARADFNVAIRTLAMRAGAATARIGLGAGIVADSVAADEWRECLLKGAFVASETRFDIFETMRFDPRDGIAQLDRHLDRMKASADLFGFRFDRHAARNDLQAATFRLSEPRKLRLLLSKTGMLAIESTPLPAPPIEPVPVALAALPGDPSDFRLRHKLSDRGFYDEARARSGAFEVIFEDSAGFLTEGSFTTIFVARGDRLLTPPVAQGLLLGVLRASLIASGRAIEADLTAADLADGFLIGNSVRGLIAATLV